MSRRTFARLLVGSASLGFAACAQKADNQSLALVTHVDEVPADGSDWPIRSFDLHCDTIDTLCMHDLEPYSGADSDEQHDGTLESTDASVSPDRMNGVRWAQCYAVWTPDDCPSVSHLEFYRRGAAFFREQMKQHKDRLKQVTDGRKIRSVVDDGKVACILTVENSCALEEGLQVIDEFEADGVKVCGLTWNGQNAVAGGVATNEGLSALGRDYVAELERRKMVVDVSHLSDTGLRELEDLATRPYIATHSNARAICNVARNLTDDQFKAIRDRGGLVGLNFHKGFVRADGSGYSFGELMTHVEHWLDLDGDDVVSLGSDRDGSDLPDWLMDCARQVTFYTATREHLGKDLAHKLFFKNAADFFARNERD